ncbi:hypothetical protein CN998_21895 [Bacillus cereus]|nr:hypothetical protein CN998_21895 [Bacillus cereus]
MAYNYPLDSFKQVWEESPIIIFDTNSFFYLYRITPETTGNILEVLKTIPKEEFWIPKQVTKEYFDNHSNVIRKEHGKYTAVTESIKSTMLVTENKLTKQFKKYNEFKYPLVKELEGKIQHAISSIKAEMESYTENIKEEVESNKEMLQEDKIKEFVEDLISSERIGEGFNYSQTLEIYNEGIFRYEYKIPPGYEDVVKDKTDETKRKKFGDLIIWKELLRKAKETERPIIFVTMDEKEDWWILDKDKSPISPREELLEEFKDYSDKTFTLMTLPNFYYYVSLINNKPDVKSYVELNALSICKELIDTEGWEETLSSNGKFESYLIHSGQIQDFFTDVVRDVAPNDYFEPEIAINSVEFVEDKVFIEADFEASVGATITVRPFDNEEAILNFSGSVSLEFKVDLGALDLGDYIDTDTVRISVEGFYIMNCELDYDDTPDEYIEDDRCQDCGNKEAMNIKANGEMICDLCASNYELCTICGKWFEQGTLNGLFCAKCE